MRCALSASASGVQCRRAAWMGQLHAEFEPRCKARRFLMLHCVAACAYCVSHRVSDAARDAVRRPACPWTPALSTPYLGSSRQSAGLRAAACEAVRHRRRSAATGCACDALSQNPPAQMCSGGRPGRARGCKAVRRLPGGGSPAGQTTRAQAHAAAHVPLALSSSDSAMGMKRIPVTHCSRSVSQKPSAR